MTRPALRALNVLRGVLVILFAGAAVTNFIGLPALVDEFQRIGLGQWFRYATALTQMTGAILLLWRKSAPGGGLLLLGVSVGAFIAQWVALHGDIIHTLVLIALVGLLAWFDARRWIEDRQTPNAPSSRPWKVVLTWFLHATGFF